MATGGNTVSLDELVRRNSNYENPTDVDAAARGNSVPMNHMEPLIPLNTATENQAGLRFNLPNVPQSMRRVYEAEISKLKAENDRWKNGRNHVITYLRGKKCDHQEDQLLEYYLNLNEMEFIEASSCRREPFKNYKVVEDAVFYFPEDLMEYLKTRETPCDETDLNAHRNLVPTRDLNELKTLVETQLTLLQRTGQYTLGRQFNLGGYLAMLKNCFSPTEGCMTFMGYVETCFDLKKSSVYNYIDFYKLAAHYKRFLNCDVTFNFFMKYLPTIKQRLAFSEEERQYWNQSL